MERRPSVRDPDEDAGRYRAGDPDRPPLPDAVIDRDAVHGGSARSQAVLEGGLLVGEREGEQQARDEHHAGDDVEGRAPHRGEGSTWVFRRRYLVGIRFARQKADAFQGEAALYSSSG